ncbi:MAG: SusC/RagA family TonB-linked outer membrane protein [Ginsengibacter sp.]
MRKIIPLFLMLFVFSQMAFSQTRKITGKVTDEKGQPVPSASVTIRGTGIGVSTNSEGSFTLNATPNARILVVSAVGFTEESVDIGNRSEVNVTLKIASGNLDEVVVMGYGTSRRSEITGNIATVKADAVQNKPVQTFDQALAGQAPGVQVTSGSGVLNSAPVFRIRGTNSISLSSYPLIIIDGVPSFTGDYSSTQAAANPLAAINPEDIESIEIAKDASSTAIYGSRAANGVLFITTKKGKKGQVKVNYNGWVGFTTPFGMPKVFNAKEYVEFKSQAVANNPAASATIKYIPTQDANGKDIDTRWYDHVYRNAFSHNHNINAAGGGENTSYYFSAGYSDQEGIFRENNFKRFNTLLNADSKFADIFTVGGKLSYSNEQNLAATNSGSLSGGAFGTAGLGRIAVVLPPILSPYRNDGTLNTNGAAIGSADNIKGISSLGYFNPVVALKNNRENNEINRIQSNAYFQVKPVADLTLRTVYGIDYLLIDNDIFWSPKGSDGFSYNGYAWAGNSIYKTGVWTTTAQFSPKIADVHNLNILAGIEQTKRESHGSGIQRENLSDPDYDVIQAGFTINNPVNLFRGQNYLFSTFGSLGYNYEGKYFLNGNLRQDEYSGLGKKQGTFWGASIGWELTKETFFENLTSNGTLQSLRLRGSYGKVGNIGGIGDYTPYSFFSSGIYGGAPTLAYTSVGNPTVEWETSKKLDLGINFTALNNRLSGEITYYRNNIDGLILYVQQAPSTGLPSSPPLNVGSMYNKGWEFALTAKPVVGNSFYWETSINATFNKNMVTKLDPTLPFILTATSGLETVNRTQEGYPVGYLWVVRTDGVDAGTGKRIFLTKDGQRVYYQNQTTTGPNNYSTNPDGTTKANTINQANDGVMYADPNPKITGGWINNFKYNNFDLNALVTFQAGNFIYYGSNAGLHDQRWWNNAADMLTETWQKTGDANKKYARPVYGDNVSNGSSMPLSMNVFKGDFAKLKSLTLGYTVKGDAIGIDKINNLRFYAGGHNLLILTKYPGPDPEVSSNGNSTTSQGVDRNTGVNARTITVGVNLSF